MCKLLKHNHLTSSALNIPNSFARVCVPLACSNCQSWVQPSPGNHHASPSLTGASDASGYSKVKTHPIRSCCLCSIHLTFVKVVACEYGGLSSFVRTISARKDDMESFFIYSCDSCMDKCFIQLRKVTHYFFFVLEAHNPPNLVSSIILFWSHTKYCSSSCRLKNFCQVALHLVKQGVLFVDMRVAWANFKFVADGLRHIFC